MQNKLELKIGGCMFLCVFNLLIFSETMQKNEFDAQKIECSSKWKECLITCLDRYGYDYLNPPNFSPLGSTYKRICQSKCTNQYDCDAAYNKLKDKGLIQ
jgi:hypothetical protein